jgi:hypothetical protein
MPARRFPPPWSLEEQAACFVVRDQSGQQLAYVYFEDEPGRRSAGSLRCGVGRACAVSVDLRAPMMRVVKSTGLPREPETPRAATEVPCIPLNWRPREILDRIF